MGYSIRLKGVKIETDKDKKVCPAYRLKLIFDLTNIKIYFYQFYI